MLSRTVKTVYLLTFLTTNFLLVLVAIKVIKRGNFSIFWLDLLKRLF